MNRWTATTATTTKHSNDTHVDGFEFKANLMQFLHANNDVTDVSEKNRQFWKSRTFYLYFFF